MGCFDLMESLIYLYLTHCSPMFVSIFRPPENVRKPNVSGGIEMKHWSKMI